MKIIKVLLGVMFLTIISFCNVEASDVYFDMSVPMKVGMKKSLSEFREGYDKEDCSFIIEDESIVCIENDYLVAYRPGTTYVHLYVCDSHWSIYKIDVVFEEGYFRVYTINELGEKKYLSMTDVYPEGSSLCLNNIKYVGIDKLNQLWLVKEIDISNNEYDNYTISSAVDIDSYIKLDGNGSLVYSEKYIEYNNDEYSGQNHFLNCWYFDWNTNGFYINSGMMPERSLFYNSSNNIIYADSKTDESVKWYFELYDNMSSFILMYDTLYNTYTYTSERWVALNSINTLDDLELFLVISSASKEKEAVRWISSDEEVATVDPITGKVTAISPGDVTIEAIPKNVDIPSVSYVLHVKNFEEGVYTLFNRNSGKYLSAESLVNCSKLELVDTVENSNAKWRVVVNPDGTNGIYLIHKQDGVNFDMDEFYLSIDENDELYIKSYSEFSYRNTSLWKIEENPSAPYYSIGIPTDENEISENINLRVESGILTLNTTDDLRGMWRFDKINNIAYVDNIGLYYDNAFIARYNGQEDYPNWNNVSSACVSSLKNEFSSEFNLNFLVNEQQIESFADICKRINGLGPDDKCPNNCSSNFGIECNNSKILLASNKSSNCTDRNTVLWQLRPYAVDVDADTLVLFCGHKLFYNENTNNRSCYKEGNKSIIMCGLSTQIDDICNTLIHEVGHVYNAPDHYHQPETVVNKQNCGTGIICSVCGLGAFRRDKTCVMNGVYTEDYTWCDDCYFDIRYNIDCRFME